MSIRAIAIMAPGIFLSQPPTARIPSMLWAPQAVSIESAITSRDTREYFMPSVPIEIPSLTVMVPKSWGMAPAARSDISARRASSSRPALHGVMVLCALASRRRLPGPWPTRPAWRDWGALVPLGDQAAGLLGMRVGPWRWDGDR
jgi:hypothetical protein